LPYVLWREVVSVEKIENVANETKLLIKQDEDSHEKNSRESLKRTPLHIDGTESWIFLELCKKLNCSLLISLGK
jgi:hypothetical protein